MKTILVIGQQGHGKTTFADMLVKVFTKKAVRASTSTFLIHRLADIEGVVPAAIFENKESYRSKLIQLGNDLCDADAGVLFSICRYRGVIELAEYVIIDGVRRLCEFRAVRDMCDDVIFVDRPEHTSSRDNFELNPEHGTIYVRNSLSLPELSDQAFNLAQRI